MARTDDVIDAEVIDVLAPSGFSVRNVPPGWRVLLDGQDAHTDASYPAPEDTGGGLCSHPIMTTPGVHSVLLMDAKGRVVSEARANVIEGSITLFDYAETVAGLEERSDLKISLRLLLRGARRGARMATDLIEAVLPEPSERQITQKSGRWMR